MKFAVVATYDNYIEAHLAMGMLEDVDIRCWLKDENAVTISPFISNAVGGIKLMVTEPQVERALRTLALIRKNADDQQTGTDLGNDR